MRFVIASRQGSTLAPDGGPAGIMTVLDMIDAPTADEAIEVFLEDNDGDRGFDEFLCIPMSDSPMTAFRGR